MEASYVDGATGDDHSEDRTRIKSRFASIEMARVVDRKDEHPSS